MKKLRIFSLCLALCLSVCLFTGCTERESPNKQEETSSVAGTSNKDELELLEGQNETIEIDEGDVEDPFGA